MEIQLKWKGRRGGKLLQTPKILGWALLSGAEHVW